MDTDREKTGSFAVALQLLGATAGLVAFITLVGGTLLWIRFDYADLPADQVLATLPRELLVIVGVHALALPVIFGLAWAALLTGIGVVKEGSWHTSSFVVPIVLGLAFAVGLIVTGGGWQLWVFPVLLGAAGLIGLWAWWWRKPGEAWVASAITWRRLEFLAAITALAIVGAVIVASRVRDLDLIWCFVGVAVGAASLGALVTVARRSTRRRDTSWVVFTACVVCGATLALVRTADEPKLEPVALKLKDGEIVAGFHLAHTSDRFYVAPLPPQAFANAEIETALEIPRADVVRSLMGKPVGPRPDEDGRALASRLRSDLAPRSTATTEVVTPDPVRTFAPLVNLHSEERLWPLRAGEFLASSVLMWAHAGEDCDWSASLGRHVAKPPASQRGKFEADRLGNEPGYAHQSAGGACQDRVRRAFSTTEHTRPYDKRGPELAGLGPAEGFYLDLADDKRGGQQPGHEREGAQRIFPAVPVYWEWHPEPKQGKDARRITYWFLYGNSKPPGPKEALQFAHEGDWERISVLLRRGKDDSHWLPVSGRYHTHDGHQDYPWSALDLVQAGLDESATHPVVYSALGSHASYPRAGTYPQPFLAGDRTAFTVRDRATSCPDCPEWRTWERLVSAEAQPWYGFGGAWGAVGSEPFAKGKTGPLGPSRYKLGGRDYEATEPAPGRPDSALGPEG